ncbi:hypothetical protein PSPO01_03203 [Paraphaeosphaeria sporulosa]
MDSSYSRDECVAAIRYYYAFLAAMFMDPSYIIEPPPDGWPNMTAEAMQELGKSRKPGPGPPDPEGLPGGSFIDWRHVVDQIKEGEADAELELLGSQGEKRQFGGKLPKSCIGLVRGGLLMGEDPDVIVLDTADRLVYWMTCPAVIKEIAEPKPTYFVGSVDGEEDVDENVDQTNEDDEDEEDDEDDDLDDFIRWGPCWPFRDFFEMLKSQFRELNFFAKDAYQVVDKWTNTTPIDGPILEGLVAMVQAIYRRHGWPDVSQYRKEECLAEIKKELDEKFPRHDGYYDRCLA